MSNDNIVDFESGTAECDIGYLLAYLEQVARQVRGSLELKMKAGGAQSSHPGLAVAQRWIGRSA